MIFNVCHSTSVSNLVLMGNKSREIHLCVNFHNLNHALDDDNYPMSSMEHILQIVSGFEMFLLLDDFSRYN